MADPIELTDPKDTAFAAIAQGALVNDTVLPSGYRTPKRDLVISGTTLVEPTAEQKRAFAVRQRSGTPTRTDPSERTFPRFAKGFAPMFIPVWLFFLLVVFAAPTCCALVVGVERWLRARDLSLFGCVSHYRDDYTFVERFCVLGIPLRSERGYHSTWLPD